MLRVDVWKKSMTAASSHAGAFETSTTTSAPSSASASPSPVIVLTPVSGDAASGSWPSSRSFSTSFDPMRPVPPMTTIFISFSSRLSDRPSVGVGRWYAARIARRSSARIRRHARRVASRMRSGGPRVGWHGCRRELSAELGRGAELAHTASVDEEHVAGVARTVVIADDDLLLREGLASLLTQAGYSVVGQAGDATVLLSLVREHRPELAIVDIRMPPDHATEGLRAAQAIREEMPEIAILVLSAYVEVKHATTLLASGKRTGYLLKSRVANIEEFLESIDRLIRGGSVVDPSLVVELLAARTADDPLGGITRASGKCSR